MPLARRRCVCGSIWAWPACADHGACCVGARSRLASPDGHTGSVEDPGASLGARPRRPHPPGVRPSVVEVVWRDALLLPPPSPPPPRQPSSEPSCQLPSLPLGVRPSAIKGACDDEEAKADEEPPAVRSLNELLVPSGVVDTVARAREGVRNSSQTHPERPDLRSQRERTIRPRQSTEGSPRGQSRRALPVLCSHMCGKVRRRQLSTPQEDRFVKGRKQVSMAETVGACTIHT